MAIPEIDEIIDRIEELSLNELENYISKFNLEIEKYIPTLALKCEQLTFIDDYGDYDFEFWFNERDKFIIKKLFHFTDFLTEKINSKLRLYFGSSIPENMYETCLDIISETVNRKIGLKIETLVDNYEFPDSNEEIDLDDPIEYEKYIEYIFNSNGWQAHQTRSTGDQGADVIAKKGDFTCIIQCKLYSQPVGNKAVQECYSAKRFYNGNDGLVVTNNSFTKSAKMLAESTGIKLLHHSEIENYIELLNL